MKRRGFTLIELLVVLAIIAVLAGILFPVFARCRQRAQQSVCVSNVRQIGMAVRMYLEDYDGRFPMGAYPQPPSLTGWHTTWHDELTGYLRGTELLFCPLAPRSGGYRVSYGCNPWVSRWTSGAAESQLGDPSRTVFATEKQDSDWPAYPPSLKGARYYQPLAPRHDGWLTVLFCDGHAQSLSLDRIEGPAAVWQF